MKKIVILLLVMGWGASCFAQDSLNVTPVGYYNTPDWAWGVTVSGNYAYVAVYGSGLRIINITNPAAPIEAGFFDTPGHAFSVAVSGNYAYVADNESGLRIINITNPAAPTEVGFHDTPDRAWGVTVSGNYAYVADNESGLRIINITNPAAPIEASFFDTPGFAYGVAVSGNYAYVADNWSGMRIINITNPAVPTEAGFYDTQGLARDVTVQGNYAYVADNESGLRIINITNPAAPIEAGFFDTPGHAFSVAVSGNYAYVADYFGGLRIINITNPAVPTEAGFYDTPGDARFVAVSGNYAYVVDWGFGLGLGIYSFSPSAPIAGIEITHPNGGETLQIQTTETIDWTSSEYFGNVHIELNRNFPNDVWEIIASNTANDGSENWEVTGPSSVNCRMRVSAVDDTLSDISDSDFSIVAFLDLTSPNGGATWNVYQVDTVRWASGGFDSVKIELNRHYPIGEWEVIADSTENDGEYEWLVTDPLSDSCRIRICALADTFCDISDGNFSIVSSQGYLALVRSAQPSVPLTSWNFGEVECPQTGAQWFRFKNFGSESIVAFQSLEPATAEFSRTTSCGAFFALAPNQVSACSVRVVFEAASDGVYADVLRVQTDAVNGVNGFVEFALLGEQISTPDAPEVVIQTMGLDAQLAWSVVDTSVGGCAVSGLWYAVFYAPTSGGPFYYHGWTADSAYTHYGVVNFSPAQFYEVIAVRGPTAVAAGLERGMEMGEVVRVIGRPHPLTPSP